MRWGTATLSSRMGQAASYQCAIRAVLLLTGAPGRSPELSQAVPSVAEETSQEKPLTGFSNIIRLKAHLYQARRTITRPGAVVQ